MSYACMFSVSIEWITFTLVVNKILSYLGHRNAIELDYKPEFIIEMEEDMNGTDSKRSRYHKQ
jgi:hypothetical protein